MSICQPAERSRAGEMLSGHGLALRAVRPDDAAALLAHLDDWDTVRMLARLPWPVAHSDVAVFLNGAAGRRARGAAFEYALLPGGAQAAPAGIVGFEFAGDVGHVGYWIGRAHWGRGLMSEALALSIPHIVAAHGLAAIESGVFHDNPASLRVQLKLGFEIVGEHPVYCRARGGTVRHIDTRLSRARALEIRA